MPGADSTIVGYITQMTSKIFLARRTRPFGGTEEQHFSKADAVDFIQKATPTKLLETQVGDEPARFVYSYIT